MAWHIESKKNKGHTYYYARKNKWTKNGPRRAEEIYLGSADKIVEAMTKLPTEIVIETYDFGKEAAFLSIADELNFQHIIDQCISKKNGFSAMELMLLVPLGRSNHKLSKVKTVDWYSKSYLPFYFDLPQKISEDTLYHILDYLTPTVRNNISDVLAKRLIDLGISPSAIFYDTTNFRTYIEKGEELAKKGKSKEGPTARNLIGLALAISDEDIPFLHETFAGNKSDKELFPIMVEKLKSKLEGIGIDPKDLVLVFDRGNNSEDNINMAQDVSGIIAGLNRNQFGDLMNVPLSEFKDSYTSYKGHSIRGFRTTHKAFGNEYDCVVIYNPATEKKKLAEYEEDKKKIAKTLKELEKKAARKTGRGRKMTPVSAVRNAERVIHKDYRTVFKPDIIDGKFCWSIDDNAEEKLKKSLGRQVVITDKEDWDTVKIMKTYNQKNLIEADFKLVKDDFVIPLFPSFHRKDNRIEANIFLCMTGVLFLRYMMWKFRDLDLSTHDLIEVLEGIQISLTKYKNSTKAKWVVNNMDITQSIIFSRLNLQSFLPK
jgi:transposase